MHDPDTLVSLAQALVAFLAGFGTSSAYYRAQRHKGLGRGRA